MIKQVAFGQLPAVEITGAGGARAIVTLFGAHLVSWTTADGAEQIFCSQRSSLDGSRAIRGGVPVIFPQFNERGPIMRHGFARVSAWSLADSGAGFAVFALAPADLTAARAAEWPHAFALRLRVQVGDDRLALTLEVDNIDAAPWSFAAALHTYHRVADVTAVRIAGVQAAPLTIGESLDAMYGDVGDVTLFDRARTVYSTQTGFTQAVVWNPGQAASASMADMAPGDYRQFVCIEPAVIEPVTLVPGATWRGHNVLRVTAN